MPMTSFKPAILVVEDDTLIRMHGVDILEEAGFRVLEADSADAAVVILSQHDDVRQLFSDIDMPGSMNGLDLARVVHDRWPAIRLLLTSGKHEVPEVAVPAEGTFVPKPWTQEMLIAKINDLLADG